MTATEAATGATSQATYRRIVLRTGAVCAIVGPLLAIIVNIAHPRPSTSNVGKHEEFAHVAAHSGNWVLIHVGLIVAFVLFVGGLVTLSYSLEDGRAAWLSRPALAAALVGGAISLVQTSIDLAARQTALDWVHAPSAEKADALRVAGAVEDLDFLLLSVELMVFFGLAFLLYGVAVTASEQYSSRLGWVAVAVGVGGLGVGLAQAFHGRASLVTLVGIPIVAGVASVWLLVIGVLLWGRAAAEPAPA
jgi:hypothetical protein